jgi:hypothetical protein
MIKMQKKSKICRSDFVQRQRFFIYIIGINSAVFWVFATLCVAHLPAISWAQEKNPQPGQTRSPVSVVDVKFTFKGKDRSAIELVPPSLPLPLKASSDKQNPFTVPLFFNANRLDIAVMLGSTVVRAEGRRLLLPVSVDIGRNNFLLTVIDSAGELYEYDLIIFTEEKSSEKSSLDNSKLTEKSQTGLSIDSAFIAKGKYYFGTHASYYIVKREGIALQDDSKPSSTAPILLTSAGFQMQVIKGLSEQFLSETKFFIESNIQVGLALSGKQDVARFPLSVRTQLILEINPGRFIAEAGLGLSYIYPGHSTNHPGDISYLLGYLVQVGGRYRFSKNFEPRGGMRVSFPSSSTTEESLFVPQPMDIYLGNVFRLNQKSSLIAELLYQRLLTQGAVIDVGSYKKLENFWGLGVIWSRQF